MKTSSTFHPHSPKSCQTQKGSLLVARVQEWSPGCQSPAVLPQAVEKGVHQKTENQTDLTGVVTGCRHSRKGDPLGLRMEMLKLIIASFLPAGTARHNAKPNFSK